MPPITNGRILFKSIPQGYPVPGKDLVYDASQTINLDEVSIPAGGVLIKTLELSMDPYMRGRMRDASVQSYLVIRVAFVPALRFPSESALLAMAGVVLGSDTSSMKHGDHVYGILPYENYIVLKDLSDLQVLSNPYKLPWSTLLGVLGMPGKTAFMGWEEYAKPQEGEKVFVTTGAGPVGSLVIQLAELAKLKVIASAGSEDKVEFMKEIGADVPFNYKTTNTRDTLAKEGPINIYWDGVGGETLEAALDAAAPLGARFIECGMISGYNTIGSPIHNIFRVLEKSITMQGFLVFNLEKKYDSLFSEKISPLVASGKIKHREQVYDGLEKVPDVMLAVQKGENKAKAVIHVAND